MDTSLLNDIVSEFDIDSNELSFSEISQGYINDTYLVKLGNEQKYILQRINTNVFKNIELLNGNMILALKQLRANDYETISLKISSGNTFYIKNNSFWRIMNYIPNSVAFNITSNPKIAFEAGRIIGKFHILLKNENLSNYPDTLENLNYLPFRITEFNTALKNTVDDLKLKAKKEIEFALNQFSLFDDFYNSDLPLRVCHNDTKLNNILFDKNNNGLCLIDLDTIMKGYFHYDFGDAIRTVVSETEEDERDLHKIGFNLNLFESFIKGLKSNSSFLTEKEIEFLPISCALMPFMHGLRALTDFLNGNKYYKVSYPEQNLDRCKSLFKLAELALKKQSEIKTIIKNTL